MSALAQYQKSVSQFIRHSKSDRRFSPALNERLELYRQMVVHTFLNALSADFPLLLEQLGIERFQQMSAQFLAEVGSQFASLDELGKSFVKFVTRYFHDQKEFIEREMTKQVELEWQRVLCLRSSLTSSEKFSRDLSELTEQSILVATPSLQISTSWAFIQNTDDSGIVPILEFPISEAERFLLLEIQNKKTVSELSQLGDRLGFDPASFQLLFSKWLSLGMIVGWRQV